MNDHRFSLFLEENNKLAIHSLPNDILNTYNTFPFYHRARNYKDIRSNFLGGLGIPSYFSFYLKFILKSIQKPEAQPLALGEGGLLFSWGKSLLGKFVH